MLQHKAFPVSLLAPAADAEPGTIEAIVAVLNNVDRGGERIRPGFFTESLARKAPKGVWGHDWMQPVAKTVLAEEWLPGDSRLPAPLLTLGGYYIKAIFNLDTQRGREAYSDIKFGIVDEFSIGYDPQETSYDKETGILDLVKGEWFEWSPVLVGMNPATALVSVKGLTLEDGEEYDWTLWDASNLLCLLVDYIAQGHRIARTDPDTLRTAAALLREADSVLGDLVTQLPPPPASNAAKSAPLRPQARLPLSAQAALVQTASAALAARCKARRAARQKTGRTISAATNARLADVEAALTTAIPALEEARDDVQELRAGDAGADTDPPGEESAAGKQAATGRGLLADQLALGLRYHPYGAYYDA